MQSTSEVLCSIYNLNWSAIWAFFQTIIMGIALAIALKQLAAYRRMEGFKQTYELNLKFSSEAKEALTRLKSGNIREKESILVRDLRDLADVTIFFSYAQHLYFSDIIHRPTYLHELSHETVDAWYYTEPFRNKWGMGVDCPQFAKLAKEAYSKIENSLEPDDYVGISFDYIPYEEQSVTLKEENRSFILKDKASKS